MPSSPAIGLRSRWAPLNASVDPSHPLAARLGAFLLPTHDIITGRRTTMNSFGHGSGGPYGRTIAGSALTGATGSSVAIADSVFTSASGCTILIAARRTTTVTYQYFGTKNSSLTGSNPLAIRTEGGGNPESPSFFRSGAGGFRYYFPNTSAATLTVGSWHVFGAAFADNLVATVPTVIVNGAIYTPASTGSGSGTVAGTGYDFMIGSRPDTSAANEQSSVEWSFCAVWTRALTTAELELASADPFCMLRQ